MFGEYTQQREIRIRFHGKANDMRNLGKCLIEDSKVTLERCQAVNVGRRADFLSDPLERHFLREHFAVAIFEMIHLSPLAISISLDGALKEPSSSWDETR